MSVRSAMVTRICVRPTSKRWFLKIIQVIMKHDPFDPSRSHVLRWSLKHSVKQTWTAPAFSTNESAWKSNGHGHSVSCVKWPLNILALLLGFSTWALILWMVSLWSKWVMLCWRANPNPKWHSTILCNHLPFVCTCKICPIFVQCLWRWLYMVQCPPVRMCVDVCSLG